MAVIVDFPSNGARTWTEVERGVFAIIREAGARDEVAQSVLDGIRPLHDILIAGLKLTLPDGDALTQTQNEIVTIALKHFCNRILIERLQREISLASS